MFIYCSDGRRHNQKTVKVNYFYPLSRHFHKHNSNCYIRKHQNVSQRNSFCSSPTEVWKVACLKQRNVRQDQICTVRERKKRKEEAQNLTLSPSPTICLFVQKFNGAFIKILKKQQGTCGSTWETVHPLQRHVYTRSSSRQETDCLKSHRRGYISCCSYPELTKKPIKMYLIMSSAVSWTSLCCYFFPPPSLCRDSVGPCLIQQGPPGCHVWRSTSVDHWSYNQEPFPGQPRTDLHLWFWRPHAASDPGRRRR